MATIRSSLHHPAQNGALDGADSLEDFRDQFRLFGKRETELLEAQQHPRAGEDAADAGDKPHARRKARRGFFQGLVVVVVVRDRAKDRRPNPSAAAMTPGAGQTCALRFVLLRARRIAACRCWSSRAWCAETRSRAAGRCSRSPRDARTRRPSSRRGPVCRGAAPSSADRRRSRRCGTRSGSRRHMASTKRR